MYGDKVMSTLIEILNEEKSEQPAANPGLAGAVFDGQIVPLLSGRPSEEIKALKGRAQSDPKGLLNALGIGALPNSDNKINNLENIFKELISGKNVPKDHAAQNFKNFFDEPQKVVAPNKTAPGLLIKLTKESTKAVSETGSPKKSLRIFAFWFASIVTAINNSSPNYFDIETNKFKFQYASGLNALLIYVSSSKSWKNL
tara:strand:- start:9006 stop:9605 length:600 start_codon:yes stop_codon:yes gene_type:complete